MLLHKRVTETFQNAKIHKFKEEEDKVSCACRAHGQEGQVDNMRDTLSSATIVGGSTLDADGCWGGSLVVTSDPSAKQTGRCKCSQRCNGVSDRNETLLLPGWPES